MIDPKRAELLKLLAEISAAYPDMRMGQLIANLATLARGPQVESIWDAEDDELIPAAKEQLRVLLDRNSQVA
jgi:hypothetical protein